jgi:hypothetical protein
MQLVNELELQQKYQLVLPSPSPSGAFTFAFASYIRYSATLILPCPAAICRAVLSWCRFALASKPSDKSDFTFSRFPSAAAAFNRRATKLSVLGMDPGDDNTGDGKGLAAEEVVE